jgi:hypothetical protein
MIILLAQFTIIFNNQLSPVLIIGNKVTKFYC